MNGDTFATAISGTASYATAAGTTAGTYSITVSGLTSANYTIAFVPGTLTVTISPFDNYAGCRADFDAVWRSGHADGDRHVGRDRHGELL